MKLIERFLCCILLSSYIGLIVSLALAAFVVLENASYVQYAFASVVVLMILGLIAIVQIIGSSEEQ